MGKKKNRHGRFFCFSPSVEAETEVVFFLLVKRKKKKRKKIQVRSLKSAYVSLLTVGTVVMVTLPALCSTLLHFVLFESLSRCVSEGPSTGEENNCLVTQQFFSKEIIHRGQKKEISCITNPHFRRYTSVLRTY